MIVTDVNELHQVSEPIHPEEYDVIFAQLEEEIKKHKNAIGLSAPQIGIKKRAFVFWGQSGKLLDDVPVLHRVANPTIIDKHEPMIRSDEGCLSIPDTYVSLERFHEIEVSDDVYGHNELTGDDARVYQHEFDHLEGILITDRGTVIPNRKMERNEPCYCGKIKDGKPVKYKKCHGSLLPYF